ncbi:hypothetical protein [Neisseria zalophi]|uniref:hypothetical protein n=1 Tax=Neisseria zalophi TaxID=640030 RepID=UPI00177D04E5|nr:hypothetical protein [Neisseria zalophi]
MFHLAFGNVGDAADPKMRLLSVSLLEALPAAGADAPSGEVDETDNLIYSSD